MREIPEDDEERHDTTNAVAVCVCVIESAPDTRIKSTNICF